MTNWAILLSGKGSTAQSAMDLQNEHNIKLVISDRAEAVGLKKAARLGIPTLVIPREGKKINWTALAVEMKKYKITHVFLLGFMRLVPESFINEWNGSVYNIHPSLLPLYPGLHAMELSYKENSLMGVTIHQVIAQMDAGLRLMQRSVATSERVSSDWDQMQKIMSSTEQFMIKKFLNQKLFNRINKVGMEF